MGFLPDPTFGLNTSNPWEGVSTGGMSNSWNDAWGGTYDLNRQLNGSPKKAYDPDPNAFRDPTADANKQAYLDAIAAAQGRAPSEFRGGQQDLIAMLQAGAAGTGPSAAQDLLKAGTDRSLSQAAALQGSLRGAGNPALQARSLQNQQAEISQGATRDASILRSQEQQAAQQALAGVLQGARGQDAGDYAELNDLVKFYTASGLSIDQAQFAAQQHLEELRLQGSLGEIGALGGGDKVGGTDWLNAATTAGAAWLSSDVRMKENVHDGSGEIQAFLDSLSAKGYDYKDPAALGADGGPQVGVMAQDMAKSPMGAQMVEPGPDGKLAIDGRGATSALLAATADLNKRLKALEAPKDAYAPSTLSDPALRGEENAAIVDEMKRRKHGMVKPLTIFGVPFQEFEPMVGR